jgi:hypothetical protein
MARQLIFSERLQVRLPAGTLARLEAFRRPDESTQDAARRALTEVLNPEKKPECRCQ